MITWARHGFATENEATAFAIEHLQQRGLAVIHAAQASPLETTKEFLGRLGIPAMRFHRYRQRKSCPHFYRECGPTGRLVRLRSNPQLEAFLAKGDA